MSSIRVPQIVPSPADDSETLESAFQGWGTDEKAIIRVLGHRNLNQRREIRDCYQQIFNQSLFDGLHSEVSGDFLKAVILWMYDLPERDARLANEALKSKGKGVSQFQVIVEVACASSPHHLIAVRQAYCSLFDCSLEEEVVSNVQVPLRKLLLSLVSSYRYDKEVIDVNIAEMEAAKLHEAIETKHLDRDDVFWILGTRNFFQLRATFDCYKEKFSNPIEKDIEKCGNGDLEALLQIAILCIDCPEKHFAQVIRASILGIGTDEDSLTRAIVTRAEVDMERIKEEYSKTYKGSIEDAVSGDTSGEYKDFLLTLLGSQF